MNTARDLTVRLAELLRHERAALAEFLVALADFDRRRLWLELGYASLFYFLHRELGLSKGAAFYRKTAAELIQRFPEVVEPLRDGRLCLTSIVELSKVLTPENQGEVLPRFFQLSKREAQAVSAAISPREAAPHRDVVTAARRPASSPIVPVPATRDSNPEGELLVHPDEPRLVRPDEPSPGASANAGEPAPSLSLVHPDEPAVALHGARDAVTQEFTSTPRVRAPSAEVAPLSAELNRLHVTVTRAFLDKLEAAREALSHSNPGAGAAEILEAGLDLLLDRHAKRRGLVKKPRRQAPPVEQGRARSGSPREAPPVEQDRARMRTREPVPAAVKREVWTRDRGRCQWALDGGGVCGSTHRVQLDHVVPVGRGGASTAANLRLLCGVHNDLAARLVYGDAWMNRYTSRGGVGAAPGTRRATVSGTLDLIDAARRVPSPGGYAQTWSWLNGTLPVPIRERPATRAMAMRTSPCPRPPPLAPRGLAASKRSAPSLPST